jgi:hypothetical protein
LIRLGCGVYARAEVSPRTQHPMLTGDGFGPVSCRVLDKLKVAWERTGAEHDFSCNFPVTAAMLLTLRP